MRIAVWMLAIVLMPTAAFASVHATFNEDCRAELGFGSGELLPGIDRGRLRRCIRLKTSESKRKPYIRRESQREIERQKAVQARELKRQMENAKDGVERVFTRNEYEDTCREEMGLTGTTIPPGPTLGQLRRCINKKSTEAVKQKRIRRSRTSVQERLQQLHQQIEDTESSKVQQAAQQRTSTIRNYRRVRRAPDSNRFKTIRNASRARTDFRRERGENSRAAKRARAEACRKVPAKEWAQCIREALQ